MPRPRAYRIGAAVCAAVVLLYACDDPSGPAAGLALEWIDAPPASLREGDELFVSARVVREDGTFLSGLNGRAVTLRFVGAPANVSSCGNECSATFIDTRVQAIIDWVSAGTWTVEACTASPEGDVELCETGSITVLPVNAVLTVAPAEFTPFGVPFDLSAGLRLPDGTLVTDVAREVRFHVTAAGTPLGAGTVVCPPGTGSPCVATTVDGIALLDSVALRLDGPVTMRVCAVAPNGEERCDPAGVRTAEVFVGDVIAAEIISAPDTLPAGDPAGATIVVQLYGNDGPLYGSTDSVHLRLRDDNQSGDSVISESSVVAVDGVATFTGVASGIVTVGAYAIEVWSGTLSTGDHHSLYVVPNLALARPIAVDGEQQIGSAGQPIEVLPVVQVLDPFGHVIVGALVTFTADAGSVTGGTQITSGGGIAEVGGWTLGPAIGEQHMVATLVASGLSDTFTVNVMMPSFIVSAMGAGHEQTCGIAVPSGIPHCWGVNFEGTVGDGTQIRREIPTEIAGGLLQLEQVTGGREHTCGLTADGEAYCWGSNEFGQMGDSSALVSFTPLRVDTDERFSTISAGDYHTCALRESDGHAFCWGPATLGRLGDGTNTGSLTPVEVIGLRSYVALALGSLHACAIEAGGAAWCWGYNEYGSLGDSTLTNRSQPVRVVGGRSYSAIAAGQVHTCGIASGSVYCWGGNAEGSLGNPGETRTAVPEPINALGILGTAARVSAGRLHACAINTVGETYCWGLNSNGQLGDSTFASQPTAVPVVGGLLFDSIEAGYEHTCATRQNGSMFCWGLNEGRIGDGTLVPRNEPTAVTPP